MQLQSPRMGNTYYWLPVILLLVLAGDAHCRAPDARYDIRRSKVKEPPGREASRTPNQASSTCFRWL